MNQNVICKPEKAMLPANMNEHYSCGVEAARCYFGDKVVSENDYVLIPNAIKISNFVFNDLTREKIRRENGLEGKHVIGHLSVEKTRHTVSEFVNLLFCQLESKINTYMTNPIYCPFTK